MKASNTTAIGLGTLFIVLSIASFSHYSHNKQPESTKSPFAIKPLTQSKTTPKRGVKRITALTSRMGSPPMPFFLASSSDVIVIGRVTKILAVRTTPVDCPDSDGWMGNHTVYAFEVEQYLKGKGANTVKIHNAGGIVNGVEYYQEDNSGLLVGERYFLFLKSYAEDRSTKKLGFIPCSVGKNTYKLGDSDELFPADVQRGKIRIDNGVLVQATDDDHPLGRWRFEKPGSDQLIGITEQEGLSVIRKAIKDSVGSGKSVVYSDAPP